MKPEDRKEINERLIFLHNLSVKAQSEIGHITVLQDITFNTDRIIQRLNTMEN